MPRDAANTAAVLGLSPELRTPKLMLFSFVVYHQRLPFRLIFVDLPNIFPPSTSFHPFGSTIYFLLILNQYMPVVGNTETGHEKEKVICTITVIHYS